MITILTNVINYFRYIREIKAVNYVIKNAKRNDPLDVLKKFEEYTQKNPMMNVGPIKGKILTDKIIQQNPKIVVEYGCYCGYSAILLGNQLQNEAKMYSIEINPYFANLANQLIVFSGLQNKVSVQIGSIETILNKLKNEFNIQKIDFLFIDHDKKLYKQDFLLAEAKGLLQKGSIVAADNIIFPGAPEYLIFMQSNKNYQSGMHESFDYFFKQNIKDAVMVSEKL